MFRKETDSLRFQIISSVERNLVDMNTHDGSSSNNSLTMSMSPPTMAKCSAIPPLAVLMLLSTLPSSSNHSTTCV